MINEEKVFKAKCDYCNEYYENGEYIPVFASLEDAKEEIQSCGDWEIERDGKCRCYECRESKKHF